MDIRQGIISSRTNLVETKKETPFPWKGIVSILLLLILGWGGVYYYNYNAKNQISKLQSDIDGLKKTRDYKEIAEVVDLEGRVSSIREIIEKKTNWMSLITKIEANTLPEITYNNLDAEKLDAKSQSILAERLGNAKNYQIEIKGTTVGINNLSKQIQVYKEGEDPLAVEIVVKKIDLKKTEGSGDIKNGSIDFIFELNPNEKTLKVDTSDIFRNS